VFIGIVAGRGLVVVSPVVLEDEAEEPPPEELDDPPPPQPATSSARSARSATRAVDLDFFVIDAGGIGRRATAVEKHHDATWQSIMMPSCELP
jgi:hypothetical protein